MFNRRDFIRALAVIPVAALVPFAAADPVTSHASFGGRISSVRVWPYVLSTDEMREILAPNVYLEHGGNVPPCRHEEPVDRVRDLLLDDPQSTVRWVYAEQELWVCHGRDGCMWAPLFDDDCRQRREDR